MKAKRSTNSRLPATIGWVLLACSIGLGCEHPLQVSVVRELDGQGISGARIQRMDLRRPYFVIGEIVPVERVKTDESGNAVLRNRSGMHLDVSAEGYVKEMVFLSPLPSECSSIIVKLRSAAPTAAPNQKHVN